MGRSSTGSTRANRASVSASTGSHFRLLSVISFNWRGLATITSCPHSASSRLTHGECGPTSNAIRQCSNPSNFSRMAVRASWPPHLGSLFHHCCQSRSSGWSCRRGPIRSLSLSCPGLTSASGYGECLSSSILASFALRCVINIAEITALRCDQAISSHLRREHFRIREVPRKEERPPPLLAEESRPDFRNKLSDSFRG